MGLESQSEVNGDVDLNNGAVSNLYREYKQHLDFVTSIGLEKRSDSVSVKKDLCQLNQHMSEDVEFVTKSELIIIRLSSLHYFVIPKCSSQGDK